MSEQFTPGQVLQQGDLDIYFADTNGQPLNVYEISYNLYYVDAGPPEVEVLIPPNNRTPVNPTLGHYFAALMVPPNASLGDYRIRWFFKETADDAVQEVVQQFVVVSPQMNVVQYTEIRQQMINSLRILLRDQNPDKYYHFAPPTHEGRINKYNRVFGQIWEDAELNEYLNRALDWWNMLPPETEGLCSIETLVTQKAVWREPVFWGAIVHALFALAVNWVHEEFDYSIGGISLSIEKSSKYESLKANAEGKFERLIDLKKETTFLVMGLRQPRYGIGVRSSFGPHVGKNILAPRSYVGY